MKTGVKKVLLIELAKRTKPLRKERGLTQEDALTDTGILFSRIEQGKRDISFSTLYKICTYFEISMKEFFEGDFEKLDIK